MQVKTEVLHTTISLTLEEGGPLNHGQRNSKGRHTLENSPTCQLYGKYGHYVTIVGTYMMKLLFLTILSQIQLRINIKRMKNMKVMDQIPKYFTQEYYIPSNLKLQARITNHVMFEFHPDES